MAKISSGTPTLEMVAQVAGVSRATVSRVVNGSTKVTPDVVAQVNSAIAQLNYVPNRAARSLASRKTNVIALIVPESTALVFNDPFLATIIQCVAKALANTDYVMNLVFASEAHSEKTRRYLSGGNVDGALVVSHHSGDHSYTDLGIPVPMVFAGRPLHPEVVNGYYIDVDNQTGASDATAHLLALGRRRLATIAGPQDMPPGIDRLAGWRSIVAESGLDDSLVEYGDFTVDSGTAAMQRLLTRDPTIDAVFAANDQMAAGAYAALAAAGRNVPEDVAVVGYDDNMFAVTLVPALTTVRQPSADLGARLADAIVQLIDGKDIPHTTMLKTSLIVRDSAPEV